jgi:hypothetical protein
VKKYIVSIELDRDARLNSGGVSRRTGRENDTSDASVSGATAVGAPCEYPSDVELGDGLERGAKECRDLLGRVSPHVKLYSDLREKRFAAIDVLGKNVSGKYRKALGTVARERMTIGPIAESLPAGSGSSAESDDEDEPEHPDADDGPAISPGRLAEAGAAGTLSATARNTLRMQAAVDALCGTQYDSDNGGSAELKDILRDCQFAAAQMNAVIRKQNPGRLIRFCDQEVSRRCFFILDQTSVADQTNE